MSEHKSRRCTICAVNWPPTYDTCPECEGETWESSKTPLDDADAQSRLNHAAFERYFVKWEIERDAALRGLESSLASTPSVDGPQQHQPA